MLNTPCPYCHYPEMPEPDPGPHPHATCPNCGKRPRAELTPINGNPITYSVRYVREAKPGRGRLKPRAFRPTPEQAKFLDDEPNQSAVISALLDRHYNIETPPPE